MAQNLCLISFKYGTHSYFSLQFPLRYFFNHYFLLAFKCILNAKYEKTLLIMLVPLFFVLTMDLIWPKL